MWSSVSRKLDGIDLVISKHSLVGIDRVAEHYQKSIRLSISQEPVFGSKGVVALMHGTSIVGIGYSHILTDHSSSMLSGSRTYNAPESYVSSSSLSEQKPSSFRL